MSLRDKLADRLIDTAIRYLRTDDALLLADECIRQMEWARRYCPELPMFIGPLSGEQKRIGDRPLDLAPDDWKPE